MKKTREFFFWETENFWLLENFYKIFIIFVYHFSKFLEKKSEHFQTKTFQSLLSSNPIFQKRGLLLLSFWPALLLTNCYFSIKQRRIRWEFQLSQAHSMRNKSHELENSLWNSRKKGKSLRLLFFVVQPSLNIPKVSTQIFLNFQRWRKKVILMGYYPK